jgi:two-component system CheB/CheR fusion protein
MEIADVVRLSVFAALGGLIVSLSEKRREAEQRLRSSERHFRLLIEHTSDVVTILDRDGIVRYESPSIERVLGYDARALLGRKVFDLVHPDDLTSALEYFQRRLHAAGPMPPVELRFRCADGSYRDVEALANTMLDQPGEFGVVVASRDITDRKRAAESFRALVESAPDAMVGCDARGRIVLVNSQSERLFGYSRQELLGLEVEALIPAALRARHTSLRAGYIGHPHTRSMGSGLELIAVRKDGTEFPAEVSLSPIQTERGLLITSIVRDVTERRRAEEQRAALIREQAARVEAEAAERRFRELVQDLDAIVWELDCRSGRLTFVSDRAEQLLGYATQRWLRDADCWLEHVSALDRAAVLDFLKNVIHEGPRSMEYRAVAAGGRELWLRLIVYVVRDEQNCPTQLRGLTVDITERKHSEEALRTSEKLAATGRLAASIAHEVNNPMASVTNLLYLLEAQRYAAIAQEEMARVSHITRQMLAFYRDSTLPVLVNFPELLDATVELYVRRVREKSINIERRFADVPALRAFPGEMRQVVSNLLLNAIEAVGESGRITVRISRSCDWTDLGRSGVRITFVDNGSGIRRENLHHIFEPFFTTKGENGTGLGLWVTQGIVRKHGGSICVASSTAPHRHGTCFSIFLPFEAAIGNKPEPLPAAAARAARAS